MLPMVPKSEIGKINLNFFKNMEKEGNLPKGQVTSIFGSSQFLLRANTKMRSGTFIGHTDSRNML